MPMTSDPAKIWHDCKHPGYVSLAYVVQMMGYGQRSAETLIAETCKHCGKPIKDLLLIDEDRLAGGM